MMVTLVLYGFATGVRSSRAIERHCREHVVYRVITGNLVPDHVTIARFICRHEQALAGLFSELLRLCGEAGLVDCGVVAVDGTRIAANASRERNHEFGQIAQEIVEQVRASDEAEDQEFGQASGDELPEQLRTPEGRREFLREAREKLTGAGRGQELGEDAEPPAEAEREYEFDPERIVARTQGREGWRREAKRQLEQQRWQDPDPIARSREERLLLAAERLEEERGAERAGNEAYEQYRMEGRTKDGRRLPSPPKPYVPPAVPDGKVNLTDPDSKVIPDGLFFVHGYNAQAAASEQQIVLAAEITNSSTDFAQLAPVVEAVLSELGRAGIPQLPEVIAADAGYWNEQHIDEIVAKKHIPGSSPPTKAAVAPRARRGPAGATTGCEQDSTQSTAASDTENDDRPSNRCSATPNTTRVSPGSSDEAGSTCAPSGGYT